MYVQWTKHLQDPVEKENFTAQIKNASTVLRRLKDLLDDKEKEIDDSETSFTAYNVPNWDYIQAHKNGYRSCLRHLRELVDLDKQREPNESNVISRPTKSVRPQPRLSL